jgi:thiol-disulfide isomerase/thioredoxin
MKQTLLLIIGIVLLVAAGAAYDRFSAPQIVPVPPQKTENTTKPLDDNVVTETVPDFKIKTIDGGDVTMQQLRGKPLLLHFWATWCAPCIAEFPAMIDLIDRYDGKVALVALSGDTNPDLVPRFIASLPPDTQAKIKKNPIYIAVDKDRSIAYEMFYTIKYPETVFVNKAGKMTHKIVGVFNEGGEDIDALMAGLISGTTSTDTK